MASDTRSVLNQNYTDNSGDSYYSNSSRIVDNMFTSSATSIAATNTNNEEISGDDNVVTEKEVPKFWKAIKTLLPKLPNKSN